MFFPRCPSIFVLIFIVLFSRAVSAADDANVRLETFRKKIETYKSENSQEQSGALSLSNQIKVLQATIAREEYEQATSMMDNLRTYSLTADLQVEWQQISESLKDGFDVKEAELTEKRRAEVESLVADTRKICLEAKTSADLDPILVRCAALQMRRSSQNNVLVERTNRKLMGVAFTLSAWANFLDLRETGNTKRANDVLRTLTSGQSDFPVLKVEDIQSRLITDDLEILNSRSALTKIFEVVKTPDDLPAALIKLKTYAASAQNLELQSLQNEVQPMQLMIAAWEAAKNGDSDVTAQAIARLSSNGNAASMGYYDALKNQIFSRFIAGKAKAWTQLTQNSGEDTMDFLGRILDELQTKNDYAMQLEVIGFASSLNRTQSAPRFVNDRGGIQLFVAAQRLETAGDILGAITNYRSVVGSAGGKYVPMAQAEAALKKLSESNPEAFKSYEGVILEEVRALRQMLIGRPMSGRPISGP